MARIPPTKASARHDKPNCKDCKHSRDVVLLNGQWLCRVHIKVSKQTRTDLSALPSFRREAVEQDGPTFTDLYPNRAARRAAERH